MRQELGRLVSEGRKKEFAAFGWKPEEIPDPQDETTFARSRLKWDEIMEPEHAGVLGWYRELIALRRSSADFACGDVKVDFCEEDRWLALRRGRFLTAFSLASMRLSCVFRRMRRLCCGLRMRFSLERAC